MTRDYGIPVAQRHAEYLKAEGRAMRLAVRWLDARETGEPSARLMADLKVAQGRMGKAWERLVDSKKRQREANAAP